jgi:hypothetical protein
MTATTRLWEDEVKTIKWFITEYRHEDTEGRYYLMHIEKVWLAGVKTGLALGFIPLIAYWIIR